jgi:hypothetical protein
MAVPLQTRRPSGIDALPWPRLLLCPSPNLSPKATGGRGTQVSRGESPSDGGVAQCASPTANSVGNRHNELAAAKSHSLVPGCELAARPATRSLKAPSAARSARRNVLSVQIHRSEPEATRTFDLPDLGASPSGGGGGTNDIGVLVLADGQEGRPAASGVRAA